MQGVELLLMCFRSHGAAGTLNFTWPRVVERFWKGSANAWVVTNGRVLVVVPLARLRDPWFGKAILPDNATPYDPIAFPTCPSTFAELWDESNWRSLEDFGLELGGVSTLRFTTVDDGDDGLQIEPTPIQFDSVSVYANNLYPFLPFAPHFKLLKVNPSFHEPKDALGIFADGFRAVLMGVRVGK